MQTTRDMQGWSLRHDACPTATRGAELASRLHAEWAARGIGTAMNSSSPGLVKGLVKASPHDLSRVCAQPSCASLSHSLRYGPYGRVPVSNVCELTAAGARGAQRKLLCMTPELLAPSGCHVVSIGSQGFWAFETDIVHNTNCTVSVFDCTGRFQVPAPLRPRVTMYRLCLGQPKLGLAMGRAVRPSALARMRIERSMPWAALLLHIGLHDASGLPRPPTLLKVDCEGARLTRTLAAVWSCVTLRYAYNQPLSHIDVREAPCVR